jgi:hypothetical protein
MFYETLILSSATRGSLSTLNTYITRYPTFVSGAENFYNPMKQIIVKKKIVFLFLKIFNYLLFDSSYLDH